MKNSLKLVRAALILLMVFANTSAHAQCGGTERWFVKTGIDPDAALINVSNVVPITIEGLNGLPNLRDTVSKGNNQMRLTEERVVYRVTGRLVLFKHEDDNDYHLVITDDSLNYSPSGQGTAGLETGTSFIAEIPDPKCVAGKKGSPAAKSQWQDQLQAVRDKFEARFPGGQGADTNLGGIPVTLTGVLFYDRLHLQTGRAINGVELHPLLDINFNDGSPPPSTTPTPTSLGGTTSDVSDITQLLANPGFEEGVTGWSGTIDDIGNFEGEKAHRGDNFAWLGGLGYSHSESLYQNVSIPSSAKTATLSFWLSVQTDESTKTKTNDKLYVQIRDRDSHVLKNLKTYSNLDKNGGYSKQSYDVSEYFGQDVQVFLKVIEDDGRATSFKVDDFALTIQ